MNLNDFNRTFFKMEADHDLLKKKIDGVLWWDIARYDVYSKIYFDLINGNKPQTQKTRDIKFKRFYTLFRQILQLFLLKIKIILFSYDVIAFRCSRVRIHDQQLDPILMPVLNQIAKPTLIIDSSPYSYHLLQLPFFKKRKLKQHSSFEYINDIVLQYFGLQLDIASMIEERFERFHHDARAYQQLLSRVNPKLILLVQNGIQKSLFYSASLLDIPVIELQHGLVSPFHPAYSYPSDFVPQIPSFFPTGFLTFSNYWLQQGHYPVKLKASIGNDYYHQELLPRSRDQSVVIVSANIYHETLAVICEGLAEKYPQQLFIYKLHPNQYCDVDVIRLTFKPYANVRVISNELTMSQLLLKSHSIVLIQSTVAYEALQSGRHLFILRKFNYEQHQDIFNQKNVRSFTDIDQIDFDFEITSPAFEEGDGRSIFFEKANNKKIKSILQQFFDN